MTYIEFFDTVALRNVSACLTYTPDRVVYIGDSSKVMNAHISNYRKVFEERGCNIEFIPRTVARSNLDKVVELLSELVETYDDCVFDITGGDEILSFALGVVFERYPDRNIQIHKFNIRNNMVYDCDMDGTTIYKEPPQISVQENVRIYGGDIVYGDSCGSETYKWDLSPIFCEDINTMWDICKNDVRYWNTQIGVFYAAETVGTVSGLVTSVSCDVLEKYMAQRKIKYVFDDDIIGCLLRNGLITVFDKASDGTLTIAYKDEQVKRCLNLAGLVLELKIFICAVGLRDKKGKLVYNDALNGVVIDWDGELHNDSEEFYDTRNEIDVLLMHDTVPVFISCKNGAVSVDELYKLETVASRFGGQYSKKVLVSTALESLGEAGKYIRQRAIDMDIEIIENIQTMDDEKLESKLKNLWSN